MEYLSEIRKIIYNYIIYIIIYYYKEFNFIKRILYFFTQYIVSTIYTIRSNICCTYVATSFCAMALRNDREHVTAHAYCLKYDPDLPEFSDVVHIRSGHSHLDRQLRSDLRAFYFPFNSIVFHLISCDRVINQVHKVCFHTYIHK